MAKSSQEDPYLKILVIDFETGGVKENENPATELAVTILDTKNLRYERPISLLFEPYYDVNLTYDDNALLKTGIDMDLLADKGVPPKEVLAMFIEQAEKANPSRQSKLKPIIGGHNIEFDIAFLLASANFCKIDLSKYVSGRKYGKTFIPSSIDTQKLALLSHIGNPDLVNHKLSSVAQFLNIDYSDGHRASHDVITTCEVLIYYLARMSDSFGASGAKVSTSQKKRYSIPL